LINRSVGAAAQSLLCRDAELSEKSIMRVYQAAILVHTFGEIAATGALFVE